MLDEPNAALPVPILTGPDGERLRRFHEKVASGAVIPPVPNGERGVSFVLDLMDLRAFQRYTVKRLGPLPVIIFFILILFPFVAALISPSRYHLAVTPRSLLINIVAPLTVAVGGFWLLWLVLQKVAQRQMIKSAFFEPQTISVSPEYLTVQAAMGEGKSKWPLVKDMVKTKDRIYILLQNNTGHIVPLWAFSSSSDAESFFAEARGYWEKTKIKGG